MNETAGVCSAARSRRDEAAERYDGQISITCLSFMTGGRKMNKTHIQVFKFSSYSFSGTPNELIFNKICIFKAAVCKNCAPL